MPVANGQLNGLLYKTLGKTNVRQMLKNGRKDVWDMFIFSRWEMIASVLYTRTFLENITTAKAL